MSLYVFCKTMLMFNCYERGLSMKRVNTEKNDLSFEGKDKVFLDVDRMINEGLAGGNVHMHDNHTNIEEARDLEEEHTPNQS